MPNPDMITEAVCRYTEIVQALEVPRTKGNDPSPARYRWANSGTACPEIPKQARNVKELSKSEGPLILSTTPVRGSLLRQIAVQEFDPTIMR